MKPASTVSPLEAIFFAALALAPDRRAAYLEQACSDDQALRQKVERLLAAQPAVRTFLEKPAAGIDGDIGLPPIAECPGSVIGRYKLLEEIAEGGMGIVYMAEQREPVRRKVALKIVKPGMDTREVIARFEAERQALAMMDHPNIAKVFDAGETESGRSFFVMELVHGTPLTDYCDENELTVRQRLELFVPVCQAVHHAHQKGIIHRDLKPSNVMVTLYDGQPVPKVIDFGIAKALDAPLTERTFFTHFGQMVGTPLYMSPEQAEARDLDVDTRSDVYSLGVMLYELLSGDTPFDRERVKKAGCDEIRRMIREDEPQPPSTRASTLAVETKVVARRKTDAARLGGLLRGDLDCIVMKALEKDRRRRYETAADFGRDVQHYLADEPIEARPPTVGERLGKWRRRHRKAVSLSGVFLAGAALAAVCLGILLTIATDQGTVKLEFSDSATARQAQVSVDGNEIRIENLGQPLNLRAGRHQLRVRQGDLEIETREFNVLRGGTEVLHVSMPSVAVAVPQEVAYDAKRARQLQGRFARQSGLPLEITNSIGMKLVLIPSGEFEMGSREEMIAQDIRQRDDWFRTPHAIPGMPGWSISMSNNNTTDEAPRHHVRITRPFYLGAYPVTREEYDRVTAASRGGNRPDVGATHDAADRDRPERLPAGNVNWATALDFCCKLSQLPAERVAGRTYGLPTEAQWEYACRAGNTGLHFFSDHSTTATREDDDNALNRYAWYAGNFGGTLHLVGLKQPNAWGLYDMYGNVQQWCHDWYGADYYGKSSLDDPGGPNFDPGGSRVLRGSAAMYPACLCRSAFRTSQPLGDQCPVFGLRVAMAPPEPNVESPESATGATANLSGRNDGETDDLEEGVALKDFFQGVPGRWIPVLRSEEDLKDCTIVPGSARDGTVFASVERLQNAAVGDGITFHSNVMEVSDRLVLLRSFMSGIQGVRAKVKSLTLDSGGGICLRCGREGFWLAFFFRYGHFGIGTSCMQNGTVSPWKDVSSRYAPPRTADGFVPIGFAAVGSRLVYEINGDVKGEWTDRRVGFGSPAIGAGAVDSHLLFKDIEVFVPIKDFDAAAMAGPSAAGRDQITNSIGATLVRVKPGKFRMGSPRFEPGRRRARGAARSHHLRAVLHRHLRDHARAVRGGHGRQPKQLLRIRDEQHTSRGNRHPLLPGGVCHVGRGPQFLRKAFGPRASPLPPADGGGMGILLPRWHRHAVFLSARGRYGERQLRREVWRSDEGRYLPREPVGAVRNTRQRGRMVPGLL